MNLQTSVRLLTALFLFLPIAAAVQGKVSQSCRQNSAEPGVRGNGITSRMFFMPVR